MSLTPADAQALRHALATVVVVPVTPLHADNVSVVKEAMAQLGLCRADVRPPSRPLPGPVKQEISAILASWGLT